MGIRELVWVQNQGGVVEVVIRRFYKRSLSGKSLQKKQHMCALIGRLQAMYLFFIKTGGYPLIPSLYYDYY
jgi:hypothetical protein